MTDHATDHRRSFETASRLAAIVESSNDAILSKDLAGVVQSWNPAAERIFGYSAAEIVGKPVSTIIPPDRLDEEAAILARVSRGERVESFETRRRTRDGRMLEVSTTVSPVRDGHGRIVGASTVMRDISARRAAEELLQRARETLEQHSAHLERMVEERTAELIASHERLRLSERMAALGTLSAGLGHDMGNLLMPVRARLDSLEAGAEGVSRAEDIHAIRLCAEQLQHLASGLRLLAVDPMAGGLGDTVTLEHWWPDIEPLLRNVLPRGVRLLKRFPPHLPPLRLAKHQLTQVVFNLVQNAGDAMKQRGRGAVTLWAERDADPGLIRVGVTDDGPGMTDEVKRRCVEPFFTTKARAISTGLGLALVQGVVKQAGGSMTFESVLDQGTTFTLVFPVATPTAAHAARPARPALLTLADPRTRSYTSTVLRNLGFEPHADAAPPGVEFALWVTDHADVAALESFVGANTARRALVVGASDLEATPRISVVDSRFASIRQQLQSIADAADERTPTDSNAQPTQA